MSAQTPVARIAVAVAAVIAIAAIAFTGVRFAPSLVAADEKARVIPPPAIDERPGTATSEIAVLAGGCFWGVQGVYQHVSGVANALSGYAGGEKYTANYDRVSMGTTGHAEAVQITFDPRKITYGRLLQVYFSVAHNPTLLNRQGPDEGPQYRSAIFPMNAEQANVAKAYIAQLNQAHVFDKPIVTKIETGRPFYAAESYHQDFLERNPTYPYIAINDLPKIGELQRLFPEVYRAKPVLVGGGG